MYPASTTKVMTLLLALESGIAMDTTIVIPQAAAEIPGGQLAGFPCFREI